MGRLLEIMRLGNPILRKRAEKVKNISGKTAIYSEFIDNLFFTQKYHQGVGIAAPQVNLAKCIIIVASYPNQRYPDAPTMEPVVMVNPEITWLSDETEKGWEGCLSVPGLRGFVSRSKQIKVKYTALDNSVHEELYSGFPARVIQHEIDHLNGIIYIDKVEITKDLIHESEYQNSLSSAKAS